MASKIRPVGDCVAIRPMTEDETSPGGIVIPDTAKEKPQEGTVVATGPGRRNHLGENIPLDVSEGDRVLIPKYGSSELVVEGEEVVVLHEKETLAVIEGGTGR